MNEKTILLVDDDINSLKLLNAICSGEGYQTITARDGQEAIEKLIANQIDLIITDILMPNVDGYYLCYKVRNHELLKSIPILIYTATYTSVSEEKVALDMGADLFLRKPASMKTILSAVSELLGKPKQNIGSFQRSDSFEIMHQYNSDLVNKLEQRNIELEEIRKNLEFTVHQRTLELQSVNEELLASNEELKCANEELSAINEKLVESNELVKEQKNIIISQKDEQLNRVLEYSNDVIWSIDLTDSKNNYVSRSIESVTGCQPSEFQTDFTLWENYIHPLDIDIRKKCISSLSTYPVQSCSYRLISKNDQEVWMREQMRVEYNNNVAVRQMGIVTDISTIKEVEKSLLQERLMLRSVIDNIPDYIFVKDFELRHIVNNKANVILLNAESERETLGKTTIDYFGSGGEKFFEDDNKVITTGIAVYNKEEVITNQKGEKTELLTTKVPLRNNEGTIVGLVGISRDITEYKKQEHKLRQYQQNLDIIFNNTKEEILLLDQEGKVVLFNKAFENFVFKSLGKYPSIGDYFWDLKVSERRGIAKELFARALAGEAVNVEAEFSLSGKEHIVHELRYEPVNIDGDIKYVTLISIDITEKKHQEIILRKSEANLRTVFDHTDDSFLLLDKDYNILMSNNATQSIIPHSHLGANILEIIPSERKEVFLDYLNKAAQGQVVKYNIEPQFNNDSQWYNVTISAIRTDDTLVGYCITTHNLTAVKKAEVSLRTSEERFQAFMDASPAIAWIRKMDGAYLFENKTWKAIQKLNPPSIRGLFHDNINESEGAEKYSVQTIELIQNVSGKQYWSALKFPIENSNGDTLLGCFAIDVTEQQKYEKELQRSQFLLNKACEIGKIGYWAYDLDQNKSNWNNEAKQIFGMDAHFEATFEGYLMTVHPEDLSRVKEAATQTIRDRTRYDIEHRIIRISDGTIRWVHERADFINDGGSSLLIGIIQDVTERKLVEEVILEYNERAEILSKATNDAIWDWDIEHDFELWNHGIQTIFGYSTDEVRSARKIRQERIHPTDYVRVEREIENSFRNNRVNWISQYQYLCSNGEYKYVMDRAYIIYKENKPVRMIGAKQDITDQTKFEQNITAIARELSELIENANTPIFGTDIHGYVNEWNKVTTTLTGFTKNEVIGKKIASFIDETNHSEMRFILSNLTSNNAVSNLQIQLKTKTKESLTILLNATPRKDKFKNITGALMVGQNITELIQYKQNLEFKVHERTRELNEALTKEKELVELKSKFVSIASHEFRTPLSTIAIVTGFLRKHASKISNEEFNTKLTSIEKQVNHMTYLLDDILMIGKTEAGKITAQTTNISILNFFTQVAKEVEESFKTHNIKLTINCNTDEFTSDEKLLRNIVINLLTNAIKFSPEAESVLLNISNTTDQIKIIIEDRGIGIATEDLTNIFTSFHRGHNVGAIEGTGLGLSIVKKAVELLSGTISFKSTIDVGTRFTVMLPTQSK